MILRDEKHFTVECDIDNEFTQAAATAAVEVCRDFWLEGAHNEPIIIECKGIDITVRPKKLGQPS